MATGSVHELDKLGLCGGMVGTVSLCGCIVDSWWYRRVGGRCKWYLPEVDACITEAMKDDDVVVHNFNVVVVKYCCASMVTQLPDGE